MKGPTRDPRRLLDGGGTAEQRALLHAGAMEEPPPECGARLLAALGVISPVAAPSSAQAQDVAGPDGTGAQGTAAGGPIAGSGGLGAAGGAKLALLALGSASLLASGALLWSRSEEPITGDARTKHNADVPAHDSVTGSATPKSSIALEIETLERVRSQLAREDGRGALSTLQRYSSKHPSGVLAHEADVLRVEALLVAGDAPAAHDLAERLLERHGDSPHRARLQGLARRADAQSAP